MNIILSSERAYTDLNYAVQFNELEEDNKEKIFNQKIVLRKWIDGVNGMFEFRCFVKDNKLNAITQYNYPWLIEELQSDIFCQEVKSKIFNYWKDNIKGLLEHFNDYVIDFGLLEDGSIFMIEINPFKEIAGTGMFKWSNDHDILFGLKRDVNKSEEDNIIFSVRRDTEIPYQDHWESFLSYMMKDINESRPYYEVFDEIK